MSEINKYKNGKIYKIWSLETPEIYVGSTCQPLHKRMFMHRLKVRSKERSHYKLYQEMNRLGIESFRMELIEVYPCDSKHILCRREGYWIRELGATLNKEVAGRIPSEYDRDNAERIAERKKIYYKNKRDYFLEKCTCSVCGVIYTTKTRKRHEKSLRHLNALEGIFEQPNTHDCLICGGTYTNKHKTRHERTKKHLKALEELNK